MLKPIYLLVAALFFIQFSSAQFSRYIIEFTNKGNNNYSLDNPAAYLSARALNNRLLYNIALDSTDLPISKVYLDSIKSTGVVTILNSSKWLNQVAIQTTDASAIIRIQGFPFVKKFAPIAAKNPVSIIANKFGWETADVTLSRDAPNPELTNKYNYGSSYNQIHLNKGEFLHNLGFSGEGMQLAVLDAGFQNYLTLPTFDSARNNNQFLGSWDFVLNQESVNGYHPHGTWCLSIMAANMPGVFVGVAPKTSYYLFRTEDGAYNFEYPIEEHYLAVALEKADSLGVNMASISLGYTSFTDVSFNHTYADMDGNTTIAARSADFAAKKGMLVVAAMGNEGASSTYKFLSTPADADSILAVGAVDVNGIVAGFSSWGPSSDGQIKPGVASMGVASTIADVTNGQPTGGSGTSFACPNMAGLTSCLWQAFPEANNMDIISTLQQSASKFSTPDDRVGYGIPDMKKAFTILINKYYQQQIRQEGCETNISFSAKANDKMSYVVERKLPTDADYIAIETKMVSGDFRKNEFNFRDDLSSISYTANISYRIKMNIDTDTSFYFTPVVVNHVKPCIIYTFTGNGNYDLATNWTANLIPPAILPAGSTIIINPAGSGICTLNLNQEIEPGGKFEVIAGKNYFYIFFIFLFKNRTGDVEK